MKDENLDITRLVLASGNQGKLRELSALFGQHGIEVVPQSKFASEDAEETGLSFLENALLKARHAAEKSGLPAVGDDSGLMVDALDGAPGIYSARYAGPTASDQDNLEKLLAEMMGIPEENRRAQFVCVMAMVRHATDPLPLFCQGIWTGHILDTPRGEGGFGYDPVFHVPNHNCSAAELDPQTKNSLSHRGQALENLLEKFRQPLP